MPSGRFATLAALRACASAGLAPKLLLLLLPWPSQKPPPSTSAATTAQATGLRAVCSLMRAIAASDAGFRKALAQPGGPAEWAPAEEAWAAAGAPEALWRRPLEQVAALLPRSLAEAQAGPTSANDAKATENEKSC